MDTVATILLGLVFLINVLYNMFLGPSPLNGLPDPTEGQNHEN
jgi:hypothetical protein